MRVGIDLGGTSAKIGLVDADYNIVARVSVPTGPAYGFAETIERLAAAVRTFAGVEAIGMGVPSSLTPDTKLLIDANNLGWQMCDAAGELQKYFQVPVAIANDADCAVLAEYTCGAARGAKSALMLTLGTGIGGGIVDSGRLFMGLNGSGFEPGHMITQQDGLPCTCGRRGCWETVASASALAAEVKRCVAQGESPVLGALLAENGGCANARMVFDACRAGDTAAQAILNRYLHALAVGISNLIILFQPDCVVIGGGVSMAGELLFAPLRKMVREMTVGISADCPDILPATLGNDAGIIGAARLTAKPEDLAVEEEDCGKLNFSRNSGRFPDRG